MLFFLFLGNVDYVIATNSQGLFFPLSNIVLFALPSFLLFIFLALLQYIINYIFKINVKLKN